MSVLVVLGCALARDDGLRLPPMGWMSWEKYGCEKDCTSHPDSCINAALFKGQADALVTTGLRDAGYNRIDIDDCFMAPRDPQTGDLKADPARFPGGIPALSAEIHGKGLLFGVYNDIGPGTCAGNPGLNVSAEPDEKADARLQRDVDTLTKEWNIDSIKIDGCGARGPMNVTYPKLGKLLNASGRQVLYSCSWPVYHALGKECEGDLHSEECFPHREIVAACSTWRVFKDIMDAFNLPGHAGIRQIIEFYALNAAPLAAASGPGAYNDYDMILAGNAGLTVAEAKIQFGMWAMFSAPLMLSNDLRTISPEFLEFLLNKEVIAVDQDPLSASANGTILVNNTNVMSAQVSVWHKPLADGTRAAALLNMGVFDAATYNLTLTPQLLGLAEGEEFELRSLWDGKELGAQRQFWLDAMEIVMLKVTVKAKK